MDEKILSISHLALYIYARFLDAKQPRIVIAFTLCANVFNALLNPLLKFENSLK